MEQKTAVDRSSIEKNIESLKKKAQSLDKFDENYALNKKNIDQFIHSLEQTPSEMTEEIEITAEIVSLTKWRINFWPKQIDKSLSTTYIADGSGVVYGINEGTQTIEIGKNPITSLAKVLRGVPEVQAASALASFRSETLKPIKITAGSGITFKTISDVLMQVGFNDKLMCKFVLEKTENGQIIRRVQLSENGRDLAEFFSSDSKPIQTQSWLLVNKSTLPDLRGSHYSYKFRPGYAVFILGPDGERTRVDSDQFLGKKIMF